MGKPAARMGDQTSHGGVITVGEPTVLIGGMAAARVGDMHTCPMQTPGTPPIPHVGGPITLGSMTVMIAKKPAARVGDMCTCTGPPDSIAMGCNTVLIGDSSAGGGAAGQTGGGSGETATSSSTDEVEQHYIDAKFVDKGGKPISGVQYKLKDPDGNETRGTLAGQVKRTGVSEGQYEVRLAAIKKAEWSSKKTKKSETVKMGAEVVGFDSGAKATFQVFRRDSNRADRPIDTISDVDVSGDTVEADWQYEYREEEGDPELGHRDTGRYSSPSFYFTVTIEDSKATSGTLRITDNLEIELKDDRGEAIANEEYVAYLASGEVRKGKLDSSGKATEKDVPPTRNQVVFPNQVKTSKLPR